MALTLCSTSIGMAVERRGIAVVRTILTQGVQVKTLKMKRYEYIHSQYGEGDLSSRFGYISCEISFVQN